MQITLNLDNDLMLAVQSLARSQGKTVGQVMTDLIRAGMSGAAGVDGHSHVDVNANLRAEHRAGRMAVGGDGEGGETDGGNTDPLPYP